MLFGNVFNLFWMPSKYYLLKKSSLSTTCVKGLRGSGIVTYDRPRVLSVSGDVTDDT